MRTRSIEDRAEGTRQVSFLVVAFAFAAIMLGTTLPTPLYPIYQAQMGFSQLTVTVIFAAYAAGVISALILFGSLSDRIGRKRLLLAGVVFSAISAAIFLAGGVASSLAALLAGRVLSGLSAGIFTGTATVFIVELAHPEHRSRATLAATAANIGGLGLGPVLAGALAEYLPSPLLLPFAVHLGLLAAAAVCILASPETVEVGRRARLRLQRLRVPQEVRPAFVTAAISGFAGFMVLGLFTALAPAFLGEVLGVNNLALIGLVVFSLFGASTAGQMSLQRVPQRPAQTAGCAALMAGAGLVGAGVGAGSPLLFVAGAVVAGAGQGMSFRAGLSAVAASSPPERRGEITSSLFVILYVAISIPVICVGAAAQRFGLVPTGVVFSLLVAALAALALLVLLVRQKKKP